MKHRITSLQDIIDLREKHGYSDDQLFSVEGSFEELTIPDFLFFHDAGQCSDYTIITK